MSSSFPVFCWFAGLLVCWFAGLLVCWFAGLLVCWFAGLLVLLGRGFLCLFFILSVFSVSSFLVWGDIQGVLPSVIASLCVAVFGKCRFFGGVSFCGNCVWGIPESRVRVRNRLYV
ncbi:MAG: hypothetical protein PSN37_02365 [Alphaproteobacteria bacterium]|nr:hypothetical protein [Alphaproteobacteria bacterium]